MPPTVRPLIAPDFPQALPMLLDMRFVDSETALEQRFPAFCTHPDWALLGAFEGETLLGYADFDNTIKGKVPLKTWSPHLQDWKTGDPTWKFKIL